MKKNYQLYILSIYLALCSLHATIYCDQLYLEEVANHSLIPRSDLFQQTTKYRISLSPNGSFIAYVAPDEQGNSYLWVKKLFTVKNATKIVPYPTNGIREFLWQFDNNHILISNAKQGNVSAHIDQVEIKTGKITNLTPSDNMVTRIIAYYPEHPQEIIVQLFPIHFASEQKNFMKADLHKINLDSGQILPHSENPGNICYWGVNKNLDLICVASLTEDNQIQICVKDDYANWRPIISKKRDGSNDNSYIPFIGFSEDDNGLYLLSDLHSNTIRLIKINLKTGDCEVIAEDSEYDFCPGTIFSTQKANIKFAAVTKEKFEQIAIDKDCETDLLELQNRFPGIIQILATDLSGDIWLVLHESDKCPSHYFVYNCKTHAEDHLFSENEKITDHPLSDILPISFIAQDGMKIHGYLTLPTHIESKNLPAIILVHGGPWARFRWRYNPLVQALANRGYVVLQVNYRGSSGYGNRYLQAGFLEMGGKASQDLLDGKNWLIEKGYADPQRIAIMGHSFGGYATLAGLTFTPNEFCCGIDLAGPTNLVEIANLSQIGSWNLNYFGSNEEFLKSRSPLYHADKITKPLMIIEGHYNTKECKGEEIVPLLRNNHLPVEYLIFPDEGHSITKPINQRKQFAAIENFLSIHLKGQCEPVNDQDSFSKLLH